MSTQVRKILTKEEAAAGLDAIKSSASKVASVGTFLDKGSLGGIASWARDIIAVLGDAVAPELTQAIATGFGISLIEAAQELTDPISAEYGTDETTSSALEDNLPLILGADSILTQYIGLMCNGEATPAYHVASLLTAASGALKRKPLIDFSMFKLYPNLYTLLVGPSGARKDTAIDYALDIVRDAVGADILNYIPGEGSPQGMYDSMVEQETATGIGDLTIIAPEMKVMFGGEKYKQSLAEWLTDWYKCPDIWIRPLRGKKLKLKNVYVCMLAGSTMDWLKEIPSTALTGGFLPRVWIVRSVSKRKWIWMPAVDNKKRAEIVGIIGHRLNNVPKIIGFDTDAEKFLRNWYETFLPIRHAAASPLMKPYYERVHVIAIKLAALLHIIDKGVGNISRDTAEKSVALMKATEPGTARVVEDIAVSEAGSIVRKVIDVIINSGGKITKPDIVKALQLQCPSRLILEALATLEYTGTLAKVIIKGKETYIIK